MRRLLPLIVALLFAPSGATSAAPAPPGQSAPINTAVPSISGNAVQGQTLTASTGSWSGPSPSFSYEWQRCEASGSSCSPIASAVSATYVLLAADLDKTLRISVVASNKNGSTLVTSAQTSPVAAPAPPTTTTSPTTSTSATTTTTSTTTPTTTTPTTTTTTTPTTTTTLLPSAYFVGNPGSGILTPWYSFNPGNGEISAASQPLGATTPGIVRASSVGGVPAYQLTATPTSYASNAGSGYQAVWLWDDAHSWDGGSVGATTWYRARVRFPSSGYAPTTGEANWFMEHHNDGGYGRWSCSREYANISFDVTTNFPVVMNQVGVNPHVKVRVMGGATCSPSTTWYDLGPLQLDHWYDLLYQITWSPNTSNGQVNVWLDGAQAVSYRGPTLYTRPDGSISHTNLDLVNYRLAANWDSTIYFGQEFVGPTRTSVGG